MNQDQKEAIKELRAENYSYACIAKNLNLPMNTVKSYCRRHDIKSYGERKNKREKYFLSLCKYCGKKLDNSFGNTKSFCCAKHRQLWWKEEYKKRQKDIA